MKHWSESDWAEWRAEREAILLADGSYEGPNVKNFVLTLEAIERYRLRCDARGLKGAELDVPKPKQMELAI